jgi:phosphoglycerol transferase MdoB-like AlkP superfamily enzyme
MKNMESSPVMTDKIANESMDNRLVAYSSLGMEKLLVIHNDRESFKDS